MNEVKNRIEALRGEMKKRNISVYLIPTADFHQSEYVSDYFKAREYMTGFTGSAGTAVITEKEAALWTDGRYFIQADRQLEGTGILLQKMGMEGVPSVYDYVRDRFVPGTGLGFDGRVMNGRAALRYEKLAEEKHGQLCWQEDLVDLVWTDRPDFPSAPAFVLGLEYAGKNTEEKLADVRAVMKEKNASWHALSSLCDIAWLLNIRGGDIAHVPVVMSFLLVGNESCCWYVGEGALTRTVREYLEKHQIRIRPYQEIYRDLGQLPAKERIMLDMGKINLKLKKSLPEGMEIQDQTDPEEKMKAVKNPVELENIRKAHIKDGVAFTKFCFWLKNNIQKTRITELSAARYLDELRSKQEHFVDISFDTISAYGPNGAMMHYAPSAEHDALLRPEGFLLVDSGGHYLEGSTDITRNIVLGRLTMEEKQMFTAVVRANLNLANAKFLYGCRGENLDILARGPLWQQGIDYRCGTGHGNGYLLNVHEGPNSFRWKFLQSQGEDGILEEGMVTTDEPGVYVEGRYGIRIENELICKKWKKNEYGQFMEFENITYAPIDLEGILPEEMSLTERGYLNEYHKKVREILSPYLTEEEREWLKLQTREI